MADRQCISTRHTVAEDSRLRFVVGPDGALVPDLAEKLPGRGAYVGASPDLLEQAVSRGYFKRHLGDDLKQTPTSKDLVSQVGSLLMARFVQQLGLARRANLAVIGSGSMRDETWIEGLLIAEDASEREALSLKGAVQPEWVEDGLPAEQLGAAFGRASVAYVGLRGSSYPSDEKMRQQILITLSRWRPFLAASACHTIG